VWRHYRMNKTIDDTPSLQLSKSLGEHFLGNIRDGTL
jgi:hypothetical protein